MTVLRVGSVTVDITPDWPIDLAGFGLRDHPSEGVAHPLHLRIAVLESEIESGEWSRAVIASADFLWWGSEFVEAFRSEISRITGAAPDSILLSASHTHSAPQTSAKPSSAIGYFDRAYHDLLVTKVRGAAADALSSLELVTISRAIGSHDLGFNRRYLFYSAGPVDRTLTVLQLRRLDGTLSTMFVHYACHPTIYQGYLISAEYCGVAMDELEKHTGATSIFLQGCCGDINGDINRDGVQARGDETVVAREGHLFAEAISSLLRIEAETLAAIPIRAVNTLVDLPFAPLPTTAELESGKNEPDALGEWRRGLLEHPKRLAASIPLQLHRLDLADNCSLLAMDGEICVEYGLHVRAESRGTVLPLGYANGMTGYVPTTRIIKEGGYEAGESIPYFGLPAPFAPEVEPILRRALSELIAAE